MVAEVIVDISTADVDRIFDYAVPETLKVVVGDRVFVSFGRQRTEGIIVGLKETSEWGDKLKPIEGRADSFTAVLPEMVELTSFLSKRFFLRKADCLRLFVPAQMRGGKVRELERTAASLNPDIPLETMLDSLRSTATAQKALLAHLSTVDWEWTSALSEQFGASALKTLRDKEYVLTETKVVNRKPYKGLVGKADSLTLTEEQQEAVKTILGDPSGKFLLHGVTGSGKTEVYMTCIEEVLRKGKTAIMLVPEISLTPQTMQRFRGRFGDDVALLHSGLSAGERYDEWLRILRKEVHIVVGARSAIFAPIENVGMIIIDEEHDSSYSSESNPRYETEAIAEWRAEYNHAALVLGSATPSLESYYRAQKGEFKLIKLTKRVNERQLPTMQLVDMCEELRAGNKSILSRALVDGLRETLESGHQAMIFLNRRGYSSFMICRKCGHVLKCTACDVSLTWHREEHLLKCHYCRNQYAVPTACPKCGSESIRYGRDGTEKVVADLQALFPQAKLLRMDNDTTRGKTGHLSILTAFGIKEADILVGTQMIAKGHDFGNVTFVGILDADMSLYIG
ncbi:MAG: primosomal protein N', partial [Clostridia bacterium]|nr:primosomal protein N' [Clostridia bacterium]